MKILWLDDLRNPFLDLECRAPREDGVINWVLNYNEFILWIDKFGLPDLISFDHDLAEEHYTPEVYWSDYHKSKDYQDWKYKSYKEKTGKDCATWLVKYCKRKELPLPRYNIHSANPVGVDYILDELTKN